MKTRKAFYFLLILCCLSLTLSACAATQETEMPDKYRTILDDLVDAFPWKISDEFKPLTDDFIYSHMYMTHNELSEIGYAVLDLDGDGQEELAIAPIGSSTVYDLYTMRDDEVLHLFSSGERYTHTLCEEGYVKLDWSQNAGQSGTDYMRLEHDELIFVERLTYDAYHAEGTGIIADLTDAKNDNCYFKSSSKKPKDYVPVAAENLIGYMNIFHDSHQVYELTYTPLSN